MGGGVHIDICVYAYAFPSRQYLRALENAVVCIGIGPYHHKSNYFSQIATPV